MRPTTATMTVPPKPPPETLKMIEVRLIAPPFEAIADVSMPLKRYPHRPPPIMRTTEFPTGPKQEWQKNEPKDEPPTFPPIAPLISWTINTVTFKRRLLGFQILLG